MSWSPRYNQWIVSLFKEYFGQNTLEIGSGRGNLSQWLPHRSKLILSDIDSGYIDLLRQSGYVVYKFDPSKKIPKSLSNLRFDSIFSSNVLEHIANDEKALLNLYKLLKPNGKILLYLPALPVIFGSLDLALGHYRRYTKKSLESKLSQAGFVVSTIKYANLVGFFAWWWYSKVLRRTSISKSNCSTFDRIIMPLLRLEEQIVCPFGQNIMAVGIKPK